MENNEKVIWRLVNVYPNPGQELKKLQSIIQDCMIFLNNNNMDKYQAQDLFVDWVIPSEISNETDKYKPLPGHIFLAIKDEDDYKDKIFEFFYRRKDIFHQNNAPNINPDIIKNLKTKEKEVKEDPLNKFSVGDKIFITRGEFSGMSGKIVRKHKDYAEISMCVFGNEIIKDIEVGFFQLNK